MKKCEFEQPTMMVSVGNARGMDIAAGSVLGDFKPLPKNDSCGCKNSIPTRFS